MTNINDLTYICLLIYVTCLNHRTFEQSSLNGRYINCQDVCAGLPSPHLAICIYMSVHTRERDRRPGFDGVKIKFYYYYYISIIINVIPIYNTCSCLNTNRQQMENTNNLFH